MIHHKEISYGRLAQMIREGRIHFAGNGKLKIYGTLSCMSGKRMKRQNRVFFTSQEEAVAEGYRPCGSCMKAAYYSWKVNSI